MVTIDVPHVGPANIVFHVNRLQSGAAYHFTVNESSGQEVGEGRAVAGDDGDMDVDIHPLMAETLSGAYELRLYDGDGSTAAKRRGTLKVPAATPLATRQFQYLTPTSGGGVPAPPPTVVRLDRSAAAPTSDEVLNDVVLAATQARMFARYRAYVDPLVCRGGGGAFAPDAYRTLVRATRSFLEGVEWAIVDQTPLYLVNGTLPYIDTVAQRYPDALSGDPCSDIDPAVLSQPCPVELIWSYWDEEAGLVQTLNHILARFQNRRVSRGPDPLARFDLHPLRPLRHLLWQWAEDEVSRLTVRRRAAEYQFEYGLDLIGRAVPSSRSFLESRPRFLESFHTLLHEAHVFFHLDDDTTVIADAFPVLNALRDTHLVMAEGAENQFGDLPTEARVQMLVMQWLLAQPEMRDFLGGRPMVPYDEPWMDRVDTMKSLQGWNTASVTHFHELAVRGEQLLLTIRYGNWNGTAVTADSAANWARAWRNQIQRYVHAYRATTGVDLVTAVDATMPAVLLARRSGAAARRA